MKAPDFIYWIERLFSEQGYESHGQSYLWSKGLIGLHVASDVLIAICYYSIPFTFAYFIWRRKNIKFSWVLRCFTLFFVAGGTTHLMEILTVWHPVYWLSGFFKAITAVTTIPTTFLLIRLVPKAIALPHPSGLWNDDSKLRFKVDKRAQEKGILHRIPLMFQRLFDDQTFADLAIGRAVEREHDKFFELSTDLFSIGDFQGRYKRLNRAWEKALGYNRSELLGERDRDFIHPEDQKKSEMVRAQILNSPEAQSSELRFRGKDGSYRWILGNAVADFERKVIYFTGRDITSRKSIEQEIQNLNAALRSRASDLELINREAETFSYSVSHDLRAPLRHIGNFTKLLTEHSGSSFDATGQRYLGVISSAVKRMGQIIDELLSLARIGRTPLTLTQVDNDLLVAEVIRSEHYGNDDHEISWAINSLHAVQADAGMLRQVWTNLIGNAVKYSKKNPHAQISISAELDLTANERVFSVRDNGVGFDMANVGKLFGVFQRLHPSSEFEGTGIGLANVRRIVSRHGGRTWAEGEVGEGAVFHFSLPLLLPAPIRLSVPITPSAALMYENATEIGP